MIRMFQDLRGVYRHPKRAEFDSWDKWADCCCFAENLRRTAEFSELEVMKRSVLKPVYLVAWKITSNEIQGLYCDLNEKETVHSMDNKLNFANFFKTVVENRRLVVGYKLDELIWHLKGQVPKSCLFCLFEASCCIRDPQVPAQIQLPSLREELTVVGNFYQIGLDSGWWI